MPHFMTWSLATGTNDSLLFVPFHTVLIISSHFSGFSRAMLGLMVTDGTTMGASGQTRSFIDVLLRMLGVAQR